MARQKRDTKAILKVIGRTGDRSDLFWWMVEQHDQITLKAKGNRISWSSVCAEAARRGKMDRLGQPPSVMTAKKTWQRVRKQVAAARVSAAAQPPSPINPSRMAKDWRPANAPPQTPPAPRPPASPGMQNQLVTVRKGSVQPDGYDPEEQMAHLFRTLKQRSGR